MAIRLPFLPALAGQWQFDEFAFVTDPNGIVQIAMPDPTRWAVIVSADQAGRNRVTSQPELGSPFGVGVPHDAPLVLAYSDYGGWLQSSLFYVTNSPFHNIAVVLVRINASG